MSDMMYVRFIVQPRSGDSSAGLPCRSVPDGG
jgi:hypothetical protein